MRLTQRAIAMRYTIPPGTLVEIRRRGEKHFRRYTTRRPLQFEQPHSTAYRGTVLYFQEGEWLISVRHDRVRDCGQRD